MPSRPCAEPLSDRLGLVGGVVVHHEVDVEAARDIAFDLARQCAPVGPAPARSCAARAENRIYLSIRTLALIGVCLRGWRRVETASWCGRRSEGDRLTAGARSSPRSGWLLSCNRGCEPPFVARRASRVQFLSAAPSSSAFAPGFSRGSSCSVRSRRPPISPGGSSTRSITG